MTRPLAEYTAEANGTVTRSLRVSSTENPSGPPLVDDVGASLLESLRGKEEDGVGTNIKASVAASPLLLVEDKDGKVSDTNSHSIISNSRVYITLYTQ
jgi:hypothetical protein